MSETNPSLLDREKFLAYLGKRAVYRGTGFLIPVTIKAMELEPDFEVKLAAVEGIVLSYSKLSFPHPPVFGVGAAWPYLDIRPNEWAFAMSGCCWNVFLDEAGCDAVVRLCKEKAGLEPDVVFQLADLICQFPTIKEIPDTVEALHERIREIRALKQQ